MSKSRELINREEVAKSINPHLLSMLRIDRQHEVAWVDPQHLLSPERFDVVAKYIYVRLSKIGCTSAWPEKVYRQHLHVWSGFEEGDGSGKCSFREYINQFEALIASFEKNGFQSKDGLVPVDERDLIIDGAHRVGIALALNERIKVVRFKNEANRYDFKYFRRLGLNPIIADAMALEYCRLSKSARVAVVFPVTAGKEDQIDRLIESRGTIIYRKNVVLSRAGRANLIRLLYRDEPWLTGGSRESPGLRHHIENRFISGRAVRFIFFDCTDLSELVETKREIRALFDLGNDSVHINDRHDQSIEIAEQVLNRNGVHFLNHARNCETPVFDALFDELRSWINKANINIERVCVDGSAVMAVYGLRDVNDLDFLYCGKDSPETGHESVSCHNDEAIYYEESIDELVIDPSHYFLYRGVKFISLPTLRHMKERRDEAKDRRDLVRIDSLGGSGSVASLALKISAAIPEAVYSMRHRSISFIKRCIPQNLRPIAKAIYDLPMFIKESLGPSEQSMIYRGFELFYSRGTSLIRTVSRGEVYEQKLSAYIIEELKKRKCARFVDVGANIGLVTLNVLHELPDIQVWAFEPGPHQAALFRKTLIRNELKHKVLLSELALSNEKGMTEFRTHRTKHASGDGLRDTERAGRTSAVTVMCETLSEFWRSQGGSNVDVVKIDTEGAELWVLEGAVELLQKLRPVVIFEMDERNLRPYPYEAMDILKFFEKNGYEMSELSGRVVTHHGLVDALAKGGDFVARPVKHRVKQS